MASLGRQLGLSNQKIAILDESVKLIAEQRDLSLAAQHQLQEALKKVQPRWYEHPVLWLGIGATLMLGSVLLIGYAMGQLRS